MISLLKKFKKTVITNSELIKKKTDEILWAQIFTSTIVDSTWLKNKSFSPGRWAVGYPVLYLLYRIYNDIKPRHILEFGLGESTKMLYQYGLSHQCDYTVFEHDQQWIDFFCQNNPIPSTHIFKTTLSMEVYKHAETRIYENMEQCIKGKKYDFINIDGPFGSPIYSRKQILNIVKKDHLKEDFIILMDDYDRLGEKNTIDDLREILNAKNIEFSEAIYSGEKDFIIICSPNYKFLCSL